MRRHSPKSLFALGVVTVALACHTTPPVSTGTPPPPSEPLSYLASQPVMVFPTQYLRTGDSLGWSASVTKQREYLDVVDSIFTAVFTDRGLIPPNWSFAADVTRIAARNPAMGLTPRAIGAEGFRGGRHHGGDPLGEPMASQLRSMIALREARLAVLPVEVRFERYGATGIVGRAIMRTAIVDVRASQLRWLGDITSDTTSVFTPEVIASLARNLAKLIVAP